MRAVFAAWLLALVPACFDPSFRRPACGVNNECPNGLVCNADRICDMPIAPGLDAAVDVPAQDMAMTTPTCASVALPAATDAPISVCPTTAAASITVAADTVLDTDAGTSRPPGLACAALTAESDAVCAVSATAITIAAGATLSATGRKPLVLIGRTIDVHGTVDVASHAQSPSLPGGFQGAASTAVGCNAGSRAAGHGGAQGGTFSGNPGGEGGDSPSGSGGPANSSIGIRVLRGGCPGSAPQDAGIAAIGGLGGGAVWLAVDDQGTITLGDTAVVNASGAGGPGALHTRPYHGGFGGGSGGLIVFKAGALALSTTAKVFANGGGGGGGATSAAPSGSGSDPLSPEEGGRGGVGAAGPGFGGTGYPSLLRTGDDVTEPGAGGGGGGGGAGAILISARTRRGTAAISPPAITVN